MKITKRNNRDLYRASVKLPNGKYKSIYGKTKKEAEEKAEKLKQDIVNDLYKEPSDVTLGQWYEYWKDNYLLDLKPRTVDAYKSIYRLYLKPVFEDRKLQSIERSEIQELINDLYDKQNLSSKTAKNTATVLKKMFREAIKFGIVATSPVEGITLPRKKGNTNQIRYLREDKIASFISTVRELYPDYAPYYEFLLYTGLRLSELLGAQIEQYNPYNSTLRIDRQVMMTHGYELTTPKNDVIRTIHLNDRCIEIIEDSITQTMKFREKGFSDYNPGNFIFINLDGSNLKLSTFYKRFKRIVEAIGMPELRVHDLRHTYATLALESGMDIKTLQENLGHSDPAFTLKRYGHSTDRMQREGASKLQNFIEGLM